MHWQPIETAPQDGTRVLLFRPTAISWARVVVGHFDSDIYAKKMRPYWTTDLRMIEGAHSTRAHVPTHYMPLEPPCAE